MPAVTQWAFNSITMPKRMSPSSVPSQRRASSSNRRQRLVEAQRMVRVTRRPAAQLLGVDLPDAEIGQRLDRRRDQVRRRGRDRVIERAGGAGRQHLHARERCSTRASPPRQLERERQQEFGDPVFQQEAVGEPLEQRVPVVLVHVDEAGHHDRAARVDHLVERVRAGDCDAGPTAEMRAPSIATYPSGKTLRRASTVTT